MLRAFPAAFADLLNCPHLRSQGRSRALRRARERQADAGGARRIALVLAAALAAAGCGGDGREEAVKTAETWLRAVGERDADDACEQMHASAVDAIRKKAGLDPKTTCLGAIRVYADSFERGAIDDVLEVGLEAEGRVKEGEVGVFPRSGPRELQVILMRRIEGEWKVASMSLAPATPEATPTGTPSS